MWNTEADDLFYAHERKRYEELGYRAATTNYPTMDDAFPGSHFFMIYAEQVEKGEVGYSGFWLDRPHEMTWISNSSIEHIYKPLK